MIVDAIKGLVSFAKVVDIYYGVELMNRCIKYIVNDTLPSDYRLIRAPGTFVRYTKLVKVYIYYSASLSLL